MDEVDGRNIEKSRGVSLEPTQSHFPRAATQISPIIQPRQQKQATRVDKSLPIKKQPYSQTAFRPNH
jgi:hypothetical protein